MKFRFISNFLTRITLLLTTSIILGCSSYQIANTPETETGQIKLLTLGDSRVEGASPNFESYRYELWKKIVQSELSIDFIGPLRDSYDYETINGQIFDGDHLGVGGFTTLDVLEHLDETLSSTFTPDIVLLGIGGNDLIGTNQSPSTVADNVRQIIEQLRSVNPNITVFVEQIVAGRPEFMTSNLTISFLDFNEEISEMAAEATSSKSKIVVINMTEGWNSDFLADDVHYNQDGAKHIAGKYFAALDEILL